MVAALNTKFFFAQDKSWRSIVEDSRRPAMRFRIRQFPGPGSRPAAHDIPANQTGNEFAILDAGAFKHPVIRFRKPSRHHH